MTPAEPQDFAELPGAALVVGASGGLGRAVSELLIQRGSAVALTYRRSPGPVSELVSLAEGAGARAQSFLLDLTDSDAGQGVVDEAAERFGGLHTVVYASGPHVPQRHLSRVTPAELQAQVAEDVGAFHSVVHPALVHLRARHGSVVAVTSAATRRHAIRDGLSTAPKAAIEALVRGLAAEEGRFGVRANSVGPGMMTDGMAQRLMAEGDLDDAALDAARANIPLRRFGTGRDIAEAVCFLASPRAAYITGQKLDIDGGYAS